MKTYDKDINNYKIVMEEDGYPSCDFKIGDIVIDDLTCKVHRIIKIK